MNEYITTGFIKKPCPICGDIGYYKDNNGVYHKCPKCSKEIINISGIDIRTK